VKKEQKEKIKKLLDTAELGARDSAQAIRDRRKELRETEKERIKKGQLIRRGGQETHRAAREGPLRPPGPTRRKHKKS
jgi:hypothetical protein